MFKRIDYQEAAGKTIQSIWDRDCVYIVFTDGTYTAIEPYMRDYDEGVAVKNGEMPTMSMSCVEFGIGTREEVAVAKAVFDEEFRKNYEDNKRLALRQLLREFPDEVERMKQKE